MYTKLTSMVLVAILTLALVSTLAFASGANARELSLTDRYILGLPPPPSLPPQAVPVPVYPDIPSFSAPSTTEPTMDIKVKDGPGSAICNAYGYTFEEMPPLPTSNMLFRYTGVDSCEEVREWKKSLGGGDGDDGGGPNNNYRNNYENSDEGYAGGITDGREYHPYDSSSGRDMYDSTP